MFEMNTEGTIKMLEENFFFGGGGVGEGGGASDGHELR